MNETHGERQPCCGPVHALHVLVWSEERDLVALGVAVRLETFEERGRVVQHGGGWVEVERAVRADDRVSPARAVRPWDGEHVVCERVPKLERGRVGDLFWGLGADDFELRGLRRGVTGYTGPGRRRARTAGRKTDNGQNEGVSVESTRQCPSCAIVVPSVLASSQTYIDVIPDALGLSCFRGGLLSLVLQPRSLRLRVVGGRRRRIVVGTQHSGMK